MIKNLLKLGAKLACATKTEVTKEVNKLLRAGAIKRSDAKTIMKISMQEICKERQKIMQFAKNELKKELSKTKRIIVKRGKLALKAHGIEIKKRKR